MSKDRKRTHKNVCFDIPVSEHHELQRVAKTRGQTLAQLMRDVLYASFAFREYKETNQASVFEVGLKPKGKRKEGVKIDLFERGD